MAAAPMTVAVHSRRRLLGEALAWCLATQPGLSVVGHTQQWVQLAQLCRLRQPEAVIADADADFEETARQLRRLTTRWPIDYVIVLCDNLSHRDSPAVANWRLFPHSRGLGALVAEMRDRYLARYHVARAANRAARLTEREVEVLGMVSSGLTAPEIAGRLAIGARSVENHKRRIYAKLGAHSQAAAVGTIAPLGILDVQQNRVLSAIPGAPPGLSPREVEILALSAHGASVRQMATTLGIAPKTVEAQLGLLYRKLGVHNRAAALAAARVHGLIPESLEIP